MQLSAVIMLGLSTLGSAQLPTMFSPEHYPDEHYPGRPTSVAAANEPVPTGVQIHDNGVSHRHPQTKQAPVRNSANNTASPAAATPQGPICPPSFDAFALLNPIRDGIAYIRHKHHCDVQSRPGWTFCQRISCSYHSGIFVCNSDQFLPVSPDCNVVAAYAQLVADNCYQDTLVGSSPYITQGEVFDMLNWHVYVGWSNC